jgi:hypothetical protein
MLQKNYKNTAIETVHRHLKIEQHRLRGLLCVQWFQVKDVFSLLADFMTISVLTFLSYTYTQTCRPMYLLTCTPVGQSDPAISFVSVHVIMF